MKASDSGQEAAAQKHYDAVETIRRAFGEFLAVPTLMIVGFLLLAGGSYTVDQGDSTGGERREPAVRSP